MIKMTVTAADNRKYVSIELPGNGNSEHNHNVGKSFDQVDQSSNFQSYQGTQEEWIELLKTTKSVVIENIGE